MTRKVEVKITGESSGLQRAVTQATGSLGALGGQLTRLQALASKALSFGGIGGAVSVAGIVAMTRAAADTATEMGRLAAIANTSTEEFTALSYAVDRHGISAEKLADIYKDVQDKIGDFLQNGGGPMKDFFDNIAPRVGVTAEAFRSLSGPDALQLYYDSLEKANLSQSDTVFYMEALASDATNLIPLLKNGGAEFARLTEEARNLGVVIDDLSAKKAKEFSDNLAKIESSSRGLQIEIGNALIPSLNRLAKEFLDARGAGLGFLEALIGIGLSDPTKSAGQQVRSLTEDIDKLKESMSQPQTSRALAMMQEELDKLVRLREYFKARQRDEALAGGENYGNEGRVSSAKPLSAAPLGQAKAANEEAAKGAEKLRDALRAAWQASVDGAKAARDEAKKLFAEASDAAQGLRDKADQRRGQSLPEGQQTAAAAQQAETATRNASFAALRARMAAMNGDVSAAEKLSADALKQAARAEKFADAIKNDGQAANILEELASIQETAIKAMAIAKQAEASQLDQQAAAQQKTLAEIEQRLSVLKADAGSITVGLETTQANEQIAALRAEIAKGATMPVRVESGSEPSGFAVGGYVRGPGTGTSDSILARLSNGEFVMRAAAVQRYGPQFMSALNNLQLPKFASGGLVGKQGGASGSPLVLDFGKLGRFQAEASADTAQQLVRVFQRAALARGKR